MDFKSHVEAFISWFSVLFDNMCTIFVTELTIFGSAESQELGSAVLKHMEWNRGILITTRLIIISVITLVIEHILYSFDKLKEAKKGLFQSCWQRKME